MKNACAPQGLCMVSNVLVIIGGINWLLIGLFNYNLVNAIFGGVAWLEQAIYIIVGIAAIIALGSLLGWCKNCCNGKSCKK